MGLTLIGLAKLTAMFSLVAYVICFCSFIGDKKCFRRSFYVFAGFLAVAIVLFTAGVIVLDPHS